MLLLSVLLVHTQLLAVTAILLPPNEEGSLLRSSSLVLARYFAHCRLLEVSVDGVSNLAGAVPERLRGPLLMAGSSRPIVAPCSDNCKGPCVTAECRLLTLATAETVKEQLEHLKKLWRLNRRSRTLALLRLQPDSSSKSSCSTRSPSLNISTTFKHSNVSKSWSSEILKHATTPSSSPKGLLIPSLSSSSVISSVSSLGNTTKFSFTPQLFEYSSVSPFLSVCLVPPRKAEIKAKIILDVFREYLITDSAVLVEDTNGCVWAFSYGSPEPCAPVRQRMKLAAAWDTSGFYTEYSDLFPNGNVKNLRRCKLRVTTNFWPPYMIAEVKPDGKTEYIDGIEFRLLKLLEEKINFTAQFQTPTVTGKTVAAYSDVAHSKTDIAIGSLLPFGKYMCWSEQTAPYQQDPIAWFVPRAMPRDRWRRLIDIFSPPLWGAVLGTLVTTAVTAWLLDRMEPNPRLPIHHEAPGLLQLWPILLGCSASLTTHRESIKVLFAVWAIYCLQVNTAYQSKLVGTLANPGLQPPLRNERQLLDSGLRVTYPPGMDAYFLARNTSETLALLKRRIPCNDVPREVARLALRQDTAIAITRKYMDYVAPRNFSENGKPLFASFDEDIYRGPILFYARSGLPAFPAAVSLVARAEQSGLLVKWWADIARMRAAPSTLSDDHANALSLEHLNPAFLYMIAGLGLATVSLLIEIAGVKKRRKNDLRS